MNRNRKMPSFNGAGTQRFDTMRSPINSTSKHIHVIFLRKKCIEQEQNQVFAGPKMADSTEKELFAYETCVMFRQALKQAINEMAARLPHLCQSPWAFVSLALFCATHSRLNAVIIWAVRSAADIIFGFRFHSGLSRPILTLTIPFRSFQRCVVDA